MWSQSRHQCELPTACQNSQQRARRLSLTLLLLLQLALSACTPSRTTPLSQEEALYRRRCGNCHDLHPPAAYSDRDWEVNVLRMRANAGINQRDANALIAWLQSHNDQ